MRPYRESASADLVHETWRSATAVLGGMLCIFLTPIQSYIWGQAESPRWILAASPVLERLLESAPIDPYDFFGRFFFLVYLAILPLCVGVHRLQRDRAPRIERLGFSMTFVGLALASLGDVGAYWGGLGQEASGFTQLQKNAFGIEGLGILVVLTGSVAFGIGSLRAQILPRWMAWLLIFAMPGGIPTAALVAYVPHGLMLPYSVTWGLVGLFTWSRHLGSSLPTDGTALRFK